MIGIINQIIIDRDGYTVGEFLKNILKISSSEIKRLKFKGSITVNSQTVTVRHLLKSGDVLRLDYTNEKNEYVKPQKIPLEILFEDEYILVINKPSGMAMHPSGSINEDTLANAVMFYYEQNGITDTFRAVNRLDRYTSGPVIIAKSSDGCYKLSEGMKQGEFEKEYIAVTKGIPFPESGTIRLPIAREADSTIKRCVSPLGRYSETQYETLRTKDGDAVVKLKLMTGRTHQIRVHMAAVGCPLKYDFLYGEEVIGKHYLLHCSKLSFLHPFSGERLVFTTEPPFN